MKKFAAAMFILLMLLSLTACNAASPDDLSAPLPNELNAQEHILQTMEAAPSNALAIVYGDEFMNFDAFTDVTRFDLPASHKARELMITAVANGTDIWVTGDTDEALWAGTLNRGESVILSADIPAEGGFRLWISPEKNEAHYQELNEKTLDLSGWIYIVK